MHSACVRKSGYACECVPVVSARACVNCACSSLTSGRGKLPEGRCASLTLTELMRACSPRLETLTNIWFTFFLLSFFLAMKQITQMCIVCCQNHGIFLEGNVEEPLE